MRVTSAKPTRVRVRENHERDATRRRENQPARNSSSRCGPFAERGEQAGLGRRRVRTDSRGRPLRIHSRSSRELRASRTVIGTVLPGQPDWRQTGWEPVAVDTKWVGRAPARNPPLPSAYAECRSYCSGGVALGPSRRRAARIGSRLRGSGAAAAAAASPAAAAASPAASPAARQPAAAAASAAAARRQQRRPWRQRRRPQQPLPSSRSQRGPGRRGQRQGQIFAFMWSSPIGLMMNGTWLHATCGGQTFELSDDCRASRILGPPCRVR